MSNSVYVASSEGRSGKVVFALGGLSAALAMTAKVGVFRPIVRGGSEVDRVLELLMSKLNADMTYDEGWGATYEQVHADSDAAMSRIIDRYYAVADRFDYMVIVGSDFTDVASPTEFSFNAAIAANLKSPMIIVVPGDKRSPEEIRVAADMSVNDAWRNHAYVAAVIANQVEDDRLDAVRSQLKELPVSQRGCPTYVIPRDPLMEAPTVREYMKAAQGEHMLGDERLLDSEAMQLIIAAMTMPHVLDRLAPGALVVTPSDRTDVLLGVLIAHASRTFPQLAGVILNGGFEIPPQIIQLIEGLRLKIPIITSPLGTRDITTNLDRVRASLTKDSTRKIDTALQLVSDYVDVHFLLRRILLTKSEIVTPLMFEHLLLDRARTADKHIVLPEGNEERILRAADSLLRRKVVKLTLLGNVDSIRRKAKLLGLDIDDADVIDPQRTPLRARFAKEYAVLRAHKGVTYDQAYDTVADVAYFGTMMVHAGLADGMVSGAVNTTAHTIRPALEIIKTAPGTSVVSSVFLMCLADKVLTYGDCAVNPDPNPEQLADIAISSAETARQFGIHPCVAMLSYSTGESGSGADVDKVRLATELVRRRAPDLLVDGPLQYDAAVDPTVAASKAKDSPVAGRATVLIFPDLNTGNNTYKAV
ncbi:MAG: phosphate acetyltransferase, partial [Dermatophilaceae bacterium]